MTYLGFNGRTPRCLAIGICNTIKLSPINHPPTRPDPTPSPYQPTCPSTCSLGREAESALWCTCLDTPWGALHTLCSLCISCNDTGGRLLPARDWCLPLEFQRVDRGLPGEIGRFLSGYSRRPNYRIGASVLCRALRHTVRYAESGMLPSATVSFMFVMTPY